VLLSAALVGTAVLSTSSATAEPKPTAAQVKRKLEKLAHQQEVASEQYNDTRETLKSVNVRLKAAQTQLERQRVQLNKSRSKVGKLASETYRRGGLSTLGLVLGDDPQSQLAQAGYLPSLSVRQAGAMNKLKAGEAKLAASEAEIRQQKKNAEAAKAKLKKTKATVKRRIAEAEEELSKLTGAERNVVTSSLDSPSIGGGSCSGDGAATAAGRAAINFACAQTGDPYVWAAAGPNAWDCSGLTMKAFAAAGISLPHSSAQQANYGTRVNDIQKGYLLFFNSPVSHVGIALGGGKMVHAPNSTTHVKVEALYDTPSVIVRL
jgi:cell wall-associated NlpC family hydrolase